jgi:hypothetical protein
MKNNMALIVLIVILVAGGAFYGGMQYQKNQRGAGGFNRQFGAAAGGSGVFGVRNGGVNRPVYGDIIQSDANSITVKMQDGSTRIILVSSTTSINKAAEATSADLKVGEKVSVFGAANNDGSMTAQNIQLNPVIRTGQGAGNNAPVR